MLEENGNEPDDRMKKNLVELLDQSEKLKRSLRNICDVKTLDERG